MFNFFSKILSRYNNNYVSKALILIDDMVITLISSCAVLLIVRYIFDQTLSFIFALVWIVSGLLVVSVTFYLFKTYRIVIRHMSLRNVSPFIWAILLKMLVQFASVIAVSDGFPIGRIFIIALAETLLLFSALIFVRALMIFVYDSMGVRVFTDKRINVLICGTDVKSVALVTRLSDSPKYRVRGFLSSNDDRKYLKIENLDVYHYSGTESLLTFARRLNLGAIIAPNEDYVTRHSKDVVADVVNTGLRIMVCPSLDEVKNGVVLRSHIRNIKIEDLLGRKEIVVNEDIIKEYFNNKVVLVTGAAGSIGSELCRQLATFGIKQLILFDNAETPMHNLRLELEARFPELNFRPVVGDIRSVNRVNNIFGQYNPQVVFHAAAYKHVPLMEENPCEAVEVNVIGTKNVVDTCIKYDVERMVMISTDKAVNPTNIMGCTKRLAEIYVQSLGCAIERGEKNGKTKFVTTRFGNVLGSNGSVIPRFKAQIESGGPVTVTHPEITRFFMLIPEACRLVMEAATLTHGNEIFVFDMGESVKIDTLARRMINLYGLVPDKDIKIDYTGLRPGEKLFEEVLADKENMLPTTNERILIANVIDYDFSEVEQYMPKLHSLASQMQIESLVRLMKSIVREFKSNNSCFEAFDN